MRHYLMSTQMAVTEKTVIEDAEDLKLSYIAGDNVKLYNHFRKQFDSPSNG